MLYIRSANQPALTTGRQPVTSRAKGNPMKANARHVPGSTRSCRTALSSSFSFCRLSLLVPARVENATKLHPKCDQKRECHFFNRSTPTTYNFDSPKWSHSSGRGGSLSLGERVRVRDRL